jgi:DNA modification methylase
MIDLKHGDCLEVLRTLPDNSVDAVVTDPPYGLSFMGKRWDYDVPAVEVWAECLRVLKPGGHLLAFAGTRTQHRMAVRIEDAGFEIRDMIAWVYGSGFPKSLDVSKAIDKQDAADMRSERQLRFTEWMRSTGLTSAQIDAITGTNMGGHYTTAASQPAVATREHFEMLRPHFGCEVPAWVEQMVDERTVESENFKRRQVVGTVKNAMSGWNSDGGTKFVDRDITTAHTEAARQWQGWGTALKPALEPITVARKPLVGTVAENVLEHGTGALNVDGCRVGTDDDCARKPSLVRDTAAGFGKGNAMGGKGHDAGRWPANLIHDGSEEVVELFPQAGGGFGIRGKGGQTYASGKGFANTLTVTGQTVGYGDTGSAARFFYCAKASKRDRDEGNIHPTVKPTDLMRYLCRLVTPPGGVVLDPFMGSGSTGKAAVLEGFRFVGVEREAEYLEIARARIKAVAGIFYATDAS